jgi:hypothetical protein
LWSRELAMPGAATAAAATSTAMNAINFVFNVSS